LEQNRYINECELIGLLCINQDLTNYQNMFDALGGILGIADKQVPSSATVSERLVPSVSSLPTNVIEEMFNKRVSNVTRLTKEERLEVIKELDKKGIFLLKGSITEVAKTLKVSDATMYRYLQMIK